MLAVIEAKEHIEFSFGERGVEFGGDDMVAHTDKGHIIDIDITEDATHAKHVLTLQIAAVAPPENLDTKPVVAALQEGTDIEFGHIVASLGIAHVLAVEPHEGGRIDTVEVKKSAAREPVIGHGEVAHVAAHGVNAVVFATIVETRARLDEGRSVAVGIFHIAIDGAVVAKHFPV